jgi:hypothetical protein
MYNEKKGFINNLIDTRYNVLCCIKMAVYRASALSRCMRAGVRRTQNRCLDILTNFISVLPQITYGNMALVFLSIPWIQQK